VDSLSLSLVRNFTRYNVFQLLRLHKRQPGAAPIRYRADLSAAFPGREFSGMRWSPGQDGQGTLYVTTPNYCIGGTLGPLPEPYTEWLRDEREKRRYGPADFIDLYNHRLNQLRFALKEDLLPELSPAPPQRCDHAQRLAALMGLGSPLLVRQIKMPPRAWLALAALLGDGRRSAADVERALTLVLDTPVRLRQMVGAWRPIEAEDRPPLGGAKAGLGRRTVLGRQVWDQQARVRITIGGWDYARACATLPPQRGAAPGRRYKHLRDLLWLLLDRQCDVEVRLQVAADGVPASRLTARPYREPVWPEREPAEPDPARYWGLRLGQTAWLRPRDGAGNHAEARFLLPAFPPGAAS
jgi:type VI secretion system protein ImpH